MTRKPGTEARAETGRGARKVREDLRVGDGQPPGKLGGLLTGGQREIVGVHERVLPAERGGRPHGFPDMRLRAVRDLVTHAARQREAAAIGKLRGELAGQAQQEVSLGTPMVGEITGRVLDHAQAHVAEIARAPERDARFTRMPRGFDRVPVHGAEGQIADAHGG